MKILRVDMATGTITSEDIEPAFTGMGGRGLTSFFINSEVPPTCDPLGPENKLIFAPGYLSGTPLVISSRLSIGAIRDQLYTLPDETRVICGHGPETTIGRERASNPFVSG